jgi:prepilin-type processing-associated H-X9-DG protein
MAVNGTAFSNDLVGGKAPPAGTPYHSLFTYLLPYIEQENVYKQIDLSQYYNAKSNSSPNHVIAFKTVIPTFICPTYPFESKDSMGYGYVDYGATVYTDIVVRAGMNGTTVPVGERDKMLARQRGVLDNLPISVAAISDGSSNTIMIGEDAARREGYITNPAYLDPATALGISIDEGSQFTTRRFWRWGEQDNGYGVSGDPLLNTTTTSFKIVNNNNAYPDSDGPNGCWKLKNNCGPNDEIFSFHPGGANVVFADGHVVFLKESASPVVVASLVSRSGSENVQDGDY